MKGDKMKKTLKLLLSVLLVATLVFSMVACTPEEPPVPPTGDVTVSTVAEFDAAFADLVSGQKIILKAGSSFDKLAVSKKTFDVEIKAEANVKVDEFEVAANTQNLTIEGANFEEKGVTLLGGTNITIKNCNFTGTANISNVTADVVTNLVVDGCEFKDLENGAVWTGSAFSIKPMTAIHIEKFNNLTVKNCSFENVQYNALQIGAQAAAGDIYIQDNEFISAGSRYINIAGIPRYGMISGNTFYDNDVVNAEDGYRKTKGAFIDCEDEGEFEPAVIIGVNTWEWIPDEDTRYINPIRSNNYVAQNQLELN
jgi:hypothetical protein